jgi:hypothetical protein
MTFLSKIRAEYPTCKGGNKSPRAEGTGNMIYGCMVIKRAQHAAYDIKYHFVWIPKYREAILTKQLKKRAEELFREIAKQYEFEIDTMGG